MELYHHGIKGQKWGVRRYQNEDGSLTSQGKSRYGRGKIISEDYHNIKKEETSRLLNTDKDFVSNYNKAMSIAKKYDLDLDDGGGGNYEKYSDAQLLKAKKEYLEYMEKYSNRMEDLYDAGEKYANDKIAEIYGDTAITDKAFYENTKSALWTAGILGIIGGIFVLPHML